MNPYKMPGRRYLITTVCRRRIFVEEWTQDGLLDSLIKPPGLPASMHAIRAVRETYLSVVCRVFYKRCQNKWSTL